VRVVLDWLGESQFEQPAQPHAARSVRSIYSFENSPSYDLIGGRLAAYLGHEVEIIGITSDSRLNNSDALHSAIGSATQETTTLTVDSVKMLAARCR
jgi:hypothetical protein